ncbi:uncharacterized protein BT62DRAFT_933442 [Guyanagaster necrorhizus]|uniref:MICOS complex subunit MIC12 n=1 Tax=Guyanagaster necrorhizus TaxID=856835 RepID=A0A9P8ASM8_9AGAR|nr:uncharacterized protein BT62DRAFT_933442 [Guyanagaster necrorhizus MCA 3950]KAG7445027.1 hypothetical protein BT62DRAFT_933442 [Guyanagaster necrorhizus MCA 3950]
MSFLVGPVSGALVAGGVYYGFSNLIQSRTEQHRKDLHQLCVRLVETPSIVIAPPSAASRIAARPFSSFVHEKWNGEVDAAYHWVRTADKRVQEWGRKLLYGE